MPCNNHKLVYKMQEILCEFKEKYSELLNIITIESTVSIRCYVAKCLFSVRDEKHNHNVLETSKRMTCKKEIEILTAFLESIDITFSVLWDGMENDLPSSEMPIVIEDD